MEIYFKIILLIQIKVNTFTTLHTIRDKYKRVVLNNPYKNIRLSNIDFDKEINRCQSVIDNGTAALAKNAEMAVFYKPIIDAAKSNQEYLLSVYPRCVSA